MKKHLRSGFTLVELVLVIAILGIISTIAVTKFGDLKRKSAIKVNLTNMQQINRAVETYLVTTENNTGMFDNFASLLDVREGSGIWTGPAGTFSWPVIPVDGDYLDIPGIYNGIKDPRETVNAAGEGGGDVPSLTEARKRNQGLSNSLLNKLAIYYLTTNDVQSLKNAGISTYLLHNFTSAQASGPANRLPLFQGSATAEDMPFVNGGPGFRASQSAFYPATLIPGAPVVIINPAKALSVYKELGLDPGLSVDELSLDGATLFADKAVTTKLYCFGIDQASTFVRTMLDIPPRSEVLGNEYYRQYIIVFKALSGGNSGGKVSFAGILDPEGNTIAGARFNTDWGN